MPRKSLFKKKNKVKKQDAEQQEETVTTLDRTTEQVTSINKDLYEEINSFGNTLINDGITMSVDMDKYAYGSITQEEVEYNPEPKTEEKPKRRRKKEEAIVEEPSNDDIFAKLAALQQARDVVIEPEEKKVEEPTKEEPKPDNSDIMKRLKELEAERSVGVMAPKKEQTKTIVREEPTPEVSNDDEKEKLILDKKTYVLKIDVTNETERFSHISLYGVNSGTEYIRFKFDKATGNFSINRVKDSKLTEQSRFKITDKKFELKFTNDRFNIQYQVKNVRSVLRRERSLSEVLGKCAWTMNSVKMI